MNLHRESGPRARQLLRGVTQCVANGWWCAGQVVVWFGFILPDVPVRTRRYLVHRASVHPPSRYKIPLFTWGCGRVGALGGGCMTMRVHCQKRKR
ncbi:hypothetical protein FIBSPDRAFT_289692 [Athelia psychrophila]|uniref:Uncharacterized protein n=1 Tax=Athelia psychrophila TaxID=1759441 RepID=A0A167XJP3_9AGAM|nr:hypothetical protein FIBSPDRAFT_289692 [Fibularhizoctonia sp. CBS 109695]